jgi:hypothetical protein
MSSGLLLTNASGNVVIDQQFSNYVITQSGSVNVNVNATINYTNYGGLIPLLFARISSSSYYLGCGPVGGSSTLLQSFRGGSSNVDWYVAFPFSVVGAAWSAYGFRVFTPNGSVCFDSASRYPRFRSVASFGEVPGYNATNPRGVALPTVPSGQKPYFLLNGISGYNGISPQGPVDLLLVAEVAQPSATNIALVGGIQDYIPGVYGTWGDYFLPVSIPISDIP